MEEEDSYPDMMGRVKNFFFVTLSYFVGRDIVFGIATR